MFYAQKQMKKILLYSCITAMTACTPKPTIDATLQSKVDSLLQEKMSEINATSGQTIIMDMKGNIKALVGNGKKQSSSLMRTVFLHEALETGKVHLSDTVDTEEGVAIINGDTIKEFQHFKWSNQAIYGFNTCHLCCFSYSDA